VNQHRSGSGFEERNTRNFFCAYAQIFRYELESVVSERALFRIFVPEKWIFFPFSNVGVYTYVYSLLFFLLELSLYRRVSLKIPIALCVIFSVSAPSETMVIQYHQCLRHRSFVISTIFYAADTNRY
jgi:hypothetical protein